MTTLSTFFQAITFNNHHIVLTVKSLQKFAELLCVNSDRVNECIRRNLD